MFPEYPCEISLYNVSGYFISISWQYYHVPSYQIIFILPHMMIFTRPEFPPGNQWLPPPRPSRWPSIPPAGTGGSVAIAGAPAAAWLSWATVPRRPGSLKKTAHKTREDYIFGENSIHICGFCMMHDDYGYFRGKLDDFLQFLSDNFILEKTYQECDSPSILTIELCRRKEILALP